VSFLLWLEESSLGEWVRSSYLGYPLMIASHAIGMAIMVGLSLALAMRLLGMFRGIPYLALNRFMPIAWAGFGLNFMSGSGLFTTQPTDYVTDVTFLLKMSFVFAGMILVAVLQTSIKLHAGGWSQGVVPGGIRLVAALSIFCWVSGIVSGRLIAYL
jgi:hypothetical protein